MMKFNIEELATLCLELSNHSNKIAHVSAQSRLNLRLAIEAIERFSSLQCAVDEVAGKVLAQDAGATFRDLQAALSDAPGGWEMTKFDRETLIALASDLTDYAADIRSPGLVRDLQLASEVCVSLSILQDDVRQIIARSLDQTAPATARDLKEAVKRSEGGT